MTSMTAVAPHPYERTDVASDVQLRGWPRLGRLAVDGVSVLAVGLAVPLAILAIGLPIAFVLRVVAALVNRF